MTLSIQRIVNGYRIVFVLCIVALSAVTIARNVGPGPHAEHAHAPIFAAVEIIAALLLLVRRTQVAGLATLLFVFVVAAAISVAAGQLPLHLVIYAASASAIVLLDRLSAHDERARSLERQL